MKANVKKCAIISFIIGFAITGYATQVGDDGDAYFSATLTSASSDLQSNPSNTWEGIWSSPTFVSVTVDPPTFSVSGDTVSGKFKLGSQNFGSFSFDWGGFPVTFNYLNWTIEYSTDMSSGSPTGTWDIAFTVDDFTFNDATFLDNVQEAIQENVSAAFIPNSSKYEIKDFAFSFGFAGTVDYDSSNSFQSVVYEAAKLAYQGEEDSSVDALISIDADTDYVTDFIALIDQMVGEYDSDSDSGSIFSQNISIDYWNGDHTSLITKNNVEFIASGYITDPSIIPEPSTYALFLGLAVTALMLFRRDRSRG